MPSPRDPHPRRLPIKLDSTSNGEFAPHRRVEVSCELRACLMARVARRHQLDALVLQKGRQHQRERAAETGHAKTQAARWRHRALSNPAANLLPASPEGVARCVEWFNWLSGTVHAVAIRQVWRQSTSLIRSSNPRAWPRTAPG